MEQSFPIFPEAASSLAGDVDALYLGWVGISAFFSLLIAGLVLYFFVRYRRRHADEVGHRERPSTLLEIGWSIPPLVIALAMFVWGVNVYVSLSRPPADAVEYFATGKQWMWKFQHPNGKREINDLHVPVGTPIKMTMISEDVIHSFYVPAFRVKADVVPGRYTTVWFEPTKAGEYHLFCAEYCGTEHSLMGGTLYAMEPADYEEWLAADTTMAANTGAASSGEALFQSFACVTCHQAGDRQRGPSLNGVFGSQVELDDGSTVMADEAYIRESILSPMAKMVAGYQPLMPTYQGQVSEDQLMELINYIKTLDAPGAEGTEASATVASADTASGDGTDTAASGAAPSGGESR